MDLERRLSVDLVYSEAEERKLALNLREVTQLVYSGALRNRRADASLLCDIHRALFDQVRGHAGKHRSSSFGSETLTFGPNRSARRSDVKSGLSKVMEKLQRSIASLDDQPEAPDYESSATHIAVWAHAEIIRIHPFEDGNGRSSRLFMNWIMLRIGLPPIPLEVPKEEYYQCMNYYFRSGKIEPLIDLALRILSDVLDNLD